MLPVGAIISAASEVVSLAQALPSIFAQIVNLVHRAEALFPAPDTGKSKTAYVLKAAEAVIQGAPILAEDADKISATIEPFVKGFVGFLNDSGLFKHADRPQGLPTAPGTTAPDAAGGAAVTIGNADAANRPQPSFNG